MVKRKQYAEEFKIESVRLLLNRGECSVADVAESLDVKPTPSHRAALELLAVSA